MMRDLRDKIDAKLMNLTFIQKNEFYDKLNKGEIKL
jgi:hypothetical protein